MSIFGKIFGGKKAEPPVTTQEAIQKLREQEDLLIKKQDFLEKKVQDELNLARQHGTKNKRAALQALTRKKQHEKQLGHIDGVLQTIEFQREALENASMNAEVLNVMGGASRALKTAHNNMDVDKVHDLMDDIAEQQTVAQEIAEAISNPSGFERGFDESELMAELEALEQEELDKQLLDVAAPASLPVVSLPEVPSSDLPVHNKPTASKSAHDKDLEDLEMWANA